MRNRLAPGWLPAPNLAVICGVGKSDWSNFSLISSVRASALIAFHRFDFVDDMVERDEKIKSFSY